MEGKTNFSKRLKQFDGLMYFTTYLYTPLGLVAKCLPPHSTVAVLSLNLGALQHSLLQRTRRTATGLAWQRQRATDDKDLTRRRAPVQAAAACQRIVY